MSQGSEVQEAKPVAWRWKPKRGSSWTLIDNPGWFLDFDGSEYDLQPLYLAFESSLTPGPVAPLDELDDQYIREQVISDAYVFSRFTRRNYDQSHADGVDAVITDLVREITKLENGLRLALSKEERGLER